MKIEIIGDDSFMHKDNKAEMVIVSIAGSQFPFSASKTITELCEVAKQLPIKLSTDFLMPFDFKPGIVGHIVKCGFCGDTGKVDGQPCVCVQREQLNSNIIEREDLVKCTRINSTDLQGVAGPDREIVTGGIYRVLKISMSNGIVTFYDIIDDNAAVPRRLQVYPNEVELYKKHGARPEKKMVYEERANCGFCGEDNVLWLNEVKNKYVAICTKCGKQIEKERPVAKPVN